MINYYHPCVLCKKPVTDDSLNIVILEDATSFKDRGERQHYCPECFKSITPEIIAKNRKRKSKSKK